MNEHKAVPNIRFKGYEEGWRDKKTLELVSERNSKIIPIDDYPLKAFIAKKGITEKGKKYNRSFLVKSRQKKYKKTEYGDLIYSSNNLEVGSIGINRYGNACISPVYSIFKVNDSLSYDFLGYLIQRKEFIFNMVRYRQGVTYGQWKIHESDFLNIQVLVPESIDEQQKIGDFFTRLDKLLDLQQQKIDKLELLKKALLQKLFPKHDAKIPELRFKGYDGEWEKEKLSKFGHTFSGLSGKTKKDFGHGKAKYITYMNVFKNPLTSKTELDDIEVDSKQHTVKYGDVLFTMSSETPDEVGMSSVWKYHLENIYLNSFSFGYRHSTKCDLNFLAFMFRSQVVREQIKILAQGISRYNISKNKMMDILAYFPTESEQQKIGNLLSKVDQLIELENKKLQNLQQVKKCLLQNMFVD